ncbi:uncharacterized protein EKO05_0004292 [Ascochyta rabiei]|uniref:Uncharacterized protein n=1 Tax=Didymella rabiei TaxID=5454 RepID=A0A162Y9H9_DIDRA|nr:uncharacterized protein EKO05_0004292 [Ascochyta rabiei]KZM19897.1 hypothetical protein ST47_g9034 [Ascochyta rabiei]UPX13793.1 hypothetical protein EKO05_0004292 [Ascochyta rabiei]
MLIRFAQAVLNRSNCFTGFPGAVDTKAICLLSDDEGASVAEPLIARAMSAYHFYGGFNIQPCGASSASAYGKNWSTAKKEAYWEDARNG